MDKQAKTRRRSPLGWALSFAGSRKGSYVGSVLLALLSVGCGFVPYIFMAKIMKGLLEKTADFPYCLTQCLWMALFFVLDRLFHAFSTTLSHQATVIGEGGASLSGGEKQRISIARVIMKDAPIIILDEATANVDPENETELTEAIEELTKEKTIIMIAHRLKTVRHADQIFVVDNGHIAQRGTHDELIKKDGIYKSFVEGRQEAASWKIA